MLTARRSHWSANRGRLFRSNGSRLCEVKLTHTRDNGMISLGGEELMARNEAADRSWCLLRDDDELLYGFSVPGVTPCVVIEDKGTDGSVKSRVRIRRRLDSQVAVYEVHRYVATLSDACSTASSVANNTKPIKLRAVASILHTDPVSEIGTELQHLDTGDAEVNADVAVEDGQHDGDDTAPSTNLVNSRDFPTPKSDDSKEPPVILTALFEVPHPRKYRVEVFDEIDDTMMAFLFFFFMLMQKNCNLSAEKRDAVTLVDELK